MPFFFLWGGGGGSAGKLPMEHTVHRWTGIVSNFPSGVHHLYNLNWTQHYCLCQGVEAMCSPCKYVCWFVVVEGPNLWTKRVRWSADVSAGGKSSRDVWRPNGFDLAHPRAEIWPKMYFLLLGLPDLNLGSTVLKFGPVLEENLINTQ